MSAEAGTSATAKASQCKFYSRKGGCRFGDRCRFAHIDSDDPGSAEPSAPVSGSKSIPALEPVPPGVDPKAWRIMPPAIKNRILGDMRTSSPQSSAPTRPAGAKANKAGASAPKSLSSPSHHTSQGAATAGANKSSPLQRSTVATPTSSSTARPEGIDAALWESMPQFLRDKILTELSNNKSAQSHGGAAKGTKPSNVDEGSKKTDKTPLSKKAPSVAQAPIDWTRGPFLPEASPVARVPGNALAYFAIDPVRAEIAICSLSSKPDKVNIYSSDEGNYQFTLTLPADGGPLTFDPKRGNLLVLLSNKGQIVYFARQGKKWVQDRAAIEMRVDISQCAEAIHMSRNPEFAGILIRLNKARAQELGMPPFLAYTPQGIVFLPESFENFQDICTIPGSDISVLATDNQIFARQAQTFREIPFLGKGKAPPSTLHLSVGPDGKIYALARWETTLETRVYWLTEEDRNMHVQISSRIIALEKPYFAVHSFEAGRDGVLFVCIIESPHASAKGGWKSHWKSHREIYRIDPHPAASKLQFSEAAGLIRRVCGDSVILRQSSSTLQDSQHVGNVAVANDLAPSGAWEVSASPGSSSGSALAPQFVPQTRSQMVPAQEASPKHETLRIDTHAPPGMAPIHRQGLDSQVPTSIATDGVDNQSALGASHFPLSSSAHGASSSPFGGLPSADLDAHSPLGPGAGGFFSFAPSSSSDGFYGHFGGAFSSGPSVSLPHVQTPLGQSSTSGHHQQYVDDTFHQQVSLSLPPPTAAPPVTESQTATTPRSPPPGFGPSVPAARPDPQQPRENPILPPRSIPAPEARRPPETVVREVVASDSNAESMLNQEVHAQSIMEQFGDQPIAQDANDAVSSVWSAPSEAWKPAPFPSSPSQSVKVAVSSTPKGKDGAQMKASGPAKVGAQIKTSEQAAKAAKQPTADGPSDAGDKKRSSQASLNDCPICFEEMDDPRRLLVAGKCGHCFHRVCLDDWMGKEGEKHQRCPMCNNAINKAAVFVPHERPKEGRVHSGHQRSTSTGPPVTTKTPAAPVATKTPAAKTITPSAALGKSGKEVSATRAAPAAGTGASASASASAGPGPGAGAGAGKTWTRNLTRHSSSGAASNSEDAFVVQRAKPAHIQKKEKKLDAARRAALAAEEAKKSLFASDDEDESEESEESEEEDENRKKKTSEHADGKESASKSGDEDAGKNGKASSTKNSKDTSKEAESSKGDLLKRKAEQLMKRRSYTAALAQFKEAIAETPGDFDLHYGAGQCALSMKQFEEAEEQFSVCVLLRDDNHKVHLSLGRIRMQQGHLSAAAESFDAAIRINPLAFESCASERRTLEQAMEKLERAKQLKEHGKLKKALSVAGEGLKLVPSCAELIELQENVKVMKDDLDMSSMVTKIRSYVEAGDYPTAEDLMTKVMGRMSQSTKAKATADVWALAASIAVMQSNYDLAVQQFEFAYQSDTNNQLRLKDFHDANQLLQAGIKMSEDNQHSEALLNFVQALEKQPQGMPWFVSSIFLQMGNSLHALGEREEARRAYSRAVESSPDNITVALSKIEYLERLGDSSSIFNAFLTARDAELHMQDHNHKRTLASRQRILFDEYTRLRRLNDTDARATNHVDYYRVLGLNHARRQASSKLIFDTFERKSMKLLNNHLHDKDEPSVRRHLFDLGEAFAVLSDPELRAEYDRGTLFEESFFEAGKAKQRQEEMLKKLEKADPTAGWSALKELLDRFEDDFDDSDDSDEDLNYEYVYGDDPTPSDSYGADVSPASSQDGSQSLDLD